MGGTSGSPYTYTAEAVNKLQAQINSLQAEKNGLETKANALQAKTNSLQAETNSLQSQKNSLQTEKSSLEAQKKSLQAQTDSLESKASSLQAQKSSLEAQKHALQEQLDERSLQDSKLKAELEQIIKENENLRKLQEDTQSKFEDLEKNINKQTDPENYDKAKQNIFDNLLYKVETIPPVKKTDKFSFAVIGDAGTGKSSIINVLLGEHVTDEGVIDTTKDIMMVHSNDKIEVYDVPGCNDMRTYTNLQHILSMKRMHQILICYTDRVEKAVNLIKLVNACHTNLIVVRNKCDGCKKKHLKQIQQAEPAIIKEKCGADFPLFLVSAKTGLNVESLTKEMGIPYIERTEESSDDED